MAFNTSSSSSSILLRRHRGHALATIFVAILWLASSSSFATFALLSVDDDNESLGAPSSTASSRRQELTSHELHILQHAAMKAALCRLGGDDDECLLSPTDNECGAKDSDNSHGQCSSNNCCTSRPTQQQSLFQSLREKRAYYYFHSGLAMHTHRAWQMAGQQHAADDNKEEEEEREYLVTGLAAKLDVIRKQLKQEELLFMESNNSHANVNRGGRKDESLHYNEVVEDENATTTITTIHSSIDAPFDNNNIRKIYQSQLDNCRNYQLHLHKHDDTFIHLMINDTAPSSHHVHDNNINKYVVDVYNVNSPSQIIERRYYSTVMSQEEEENNYINDDESSSSSSSSSNPNLYVRYFGSSSPSSSTTTTTIDHHYYYYGLVAKRDYRMGEIVYTNIHHRRHHFHRKRKTNVLYFQDGNEWNRFVNSFINNTTATTTNNDNNDGHYDSNENEGKDDDIDNTNDSTTTSSSQHSLACLVVESSSVKRISKPGRYVIVVDIDMGLFARRTRVKGSDDNNDGNVALVDKLDRFDWLVLRDINAGEEILVQFDNDGIEKKVEYDYTYYDDDNNDRDDEKGEEQEEEGVVVEEGMECISTPTICGCDKIKQSDYRGNISLTENGRTCQKWDEQSPHVHYWISIDYPNADLHDNNYCRSPDGEWPWCITTDTNVLWEYCDIPSCPRIMTNCNESIKPCLNNNRGQYS